MAPLHVVTGALGYSGRVIAERLLGRGDRVRTLTNSRGRANPFREALEVRPLDFGRPGELAASMRGARTLVNTYWVRFDYRGGGLAFTHGEAVEHSRTLFEAAREAGVERIVHVSILNPRGVEAPEAEAPDAGRIARGLSYYRGKAEVEEALGRITREAGMSAAIVRPGVLFGRGDILVNNIAWALRRLPVFGVPGDGSYGIRPMHVEDFADLIVSAIDGAGDSVTDAVGPERFAYIEMVRRIRDALGVRTPVVRVPAWAALAAARGLGPLVRDVVLTREEIAGLTAGLLDSEQESTGRVALTAWAREHADELGRRYASELGRRR